MISADDTILYTILYTGTTKDIKTISSLEIKYLRGYNNAAHAKYKTTASENLIIIWR